MPEPDELDALRAADPLDRASLPSPEDPMARALFERITMTETTSQATTSTPSSHRRPLLLAIAAAIVLVALVAAGISLGRDTADDTPTPDDLASGPITPGGPSTGSCVELYGLDTLANREVALDGTVASVDGDRVTFAVNHWYRGGDADQVTLSGASALSGITSAGEAMALDPGTRLLVAGDGGFAWSCGFTQPYDATIADQWADALAG